MDALRSLGREAFVFGSASVDLYRVLHDFALDGTSPEFKAPLNQIGHSRRLADPSDTSIVNMNVDTPYSFAWLDLRAEPIVLTMPAFGADRYVSAMLVDLYPYIVGYVSPRTFGHGGGDFLITGPAWTGQPPPGMPVFAVPTELALVMIRTQLFDDEDMPEVIALQGGMHVTPLSEHLGTPSPDRAPALVPISPVDIRASPGVDFLTVLDWMLQRMPVLPEHAAIRQQLAEIGVGAAGLDAVLQDPAAAVELVAGLTQGRDDVLARTATVRSSAELFGSRELLGTDDASRAAGAYLGILGNAAEEFLGVGYRADASGRPFDGGVRYTITFTPSGLPPVGAFWSITVYDEAQLLYANELDRYSISSRMLPGLRRDDDGSITVQVQHERPDDATNWLPCPAGPFGLTFRTYLPGQEIRDGSWTAPPVQPEGSEG